MLLFAFKVTLFDCQIKLRAPVAFDAFLILSFISSMSLNSKFITKPKYVNDLENYIRLSLSIAKGSVSFALLYNLCLSSLVMLIVFFWVMVPDSGGI